LAPTLKDMIQVACCIIRSPQFGDDILIARKKGPIPNLEFPGGKVESNESLFETAKREISEELGVEVFPYQTLQSVILEDKGYELVPVLCLLKDLNQQFKLNEHEEILWLNPKTVNKKHSLLPSNQKILKLYLTHIETQIKPFASGISGLIEEKSYQTDFNTFLTELIELNKGLSAATELIENMPNHNYVVYLLARDGLNFWLIINKFSPHFATSLQVAQGINTYVDLNFNIPEDFTYLKSHLLNTVFDADNTGVPELMFDIGQNELAWLSYFTPATVGQFVFNAFQSKIK
jgi:8-oxo-dGTP diphosphatase